MDGDISGSPWLASQEQDLHHSLNHYLDVIHIIYEDNGEIHDEEDEVRERTNLGLES